MKGGRHGIFRQAHFRGLHEAGVQPLRPSGGNARLDAGGQAGKAPAGGHHGGRHDGQPRRVHAAPREQAHPTTLPQRRAAALPNAPPQDLLPQVGRGAVHQHPHEGDNPRQGGRQGERTPKETKQQKKDKP